MTPSEELELRRRQLRARDGKPGYKANCEALRARIYELENAPVFSPNTEVVNAPEVG